MRYYYKDRQWVHLGFPYNEGIIKKIKKIKGAKYNGALKEWYVLLDGNTNYSIQEIIKEYDFVKERVEKIDLSLLKERPPDLISKSDVEEIIGSLNLRREPREYQIEGVHYLLNHPNSINGDDCGLGKTGQGILVAEILDLFPLLVITPSSVKYGWKKEWEKWCQRDVSVINGKETDWDQDVVVINYDLISRMSNSSPIFNKEWKCVFFDEIHYLKNPNSKRSRVAYKISSPVKNVFGFSGTVILNKPFDLKNPLVLIKQWNKIFEDSSYFIGRYCSGKITTFGFDINGAANLEELNKVLNHYCYIRRDKREALPELPPIIPQYIECDIINKKEYQKVSKDVISYLRTIDIEKAISAGNAPYLVKINLLKDLSIKGKIDDITAWIKEWLESNDGKLVVFGMRREPLKILSEQFKSFLIQGGVDAKKKQEIIELFGTSEERVLFANILSIGTGTDGLQEIASNMAFIEFPDRYTDLEQAMSRLERQGQMLTINLYYLMSPITIDNYLWQIVSEKKRITDAVNKGVMHQEDDFLKSLFKKMVSL